MISLSDPTVHLTSLQKKMLPALSLPLPSVCPTALRYSLAKYDADSVAEAYEGLRELEAAEKLQQEP